MKMGDHFFCSPSQLDELVDKYFREISEGDYLVLITMRHANEVVSAKDLPSPGGRAIDTKELNMAKQLVQALEGEFDPSEFHDQYREKVMELIEKKGKGKAPRLHVVKSKRAPASLKNALERSLKFVKKEKAAA